MQAVKAIYIFAPLFGNLANVVSTFFYPLDNFEKSGTIPLADKNIPLSAKGIHPSANTVFQNAISHTGICCSGPTGQGKRKGGNLMALTDEIYRWVSSMKCAHISKNQNRIHFYNQTHKGTIAFYEGYILELSVEDCQSGHMLPEFQEKYGDKVLAIDFMDFASRNVNHVLNLIAQKAGTAA